MESKEYCVTYDVPPTGYDVNIKAQSKKEAIAKVKEVIPDAFNLSAWEVKRETTEETKI